MKQAHVMRLGVVICTFLAAAAGRERIKAGAHDTSAEQKGS